MKKIIAIAVTLCAFAATTATAAEPSAAKGSRVKGSAAKEQASKGLYVAVDGGMASNKDLCKNAPSGAKCTDKAMAYRFAGGYRFNPNFGVEAGYGSLGSYDNSYTSSYTFGTSTATGSFKSQSKYTALQIAATGILPVNPSFALIGKLGIAKTTSKGSGEYTSTTTTPGFPTTTFSGSSSGSATSTKPFFGIGAQHSLSGNMDVRAMYERFTFSNSGQSTNFSLFSAGVVMKF